MEDYTVLLLLILLCLIALTYFVIRLSKYFTFRGNDKERSHEYLLDAILFLAIYFISKFYALVEAVERIGYKGAAYFFAATILYFALLVVLALKRLKKEAE